MHVKEECEVGFVSVIRQSCVVCESFGVGRDVELDMEHRGAGVAVRAAYHEERRWARQEAARLAAR